MHPLLQLQYLFSRKITIEIFENIDSLSLNEFAKILKDLYKVRFDFFQFHPFNLFEKILTLVKNVVFLYYE